MRAAHLCRALALACFVFSAGTAGAGEIPVYPGSKLIIEKEEGEEHACCDFLTRDPLDKVVAFYESALKTKAMTPKEFAAKYPDLKLQVDEMQRQTPPGVKVRLFALAVHKAGGKTGAETLDVVSSAAGVRFSVMESQLAAGDAHFAQEWREKTHVAGGSVAARAVAWETLASALPKAGPAGFETGEVMGEGGPERSTVNVSYTKVLSMGRGGEGDDVQSITVSLMIEDTAGNAEYASDMIKPEGGEERPVKVKGAYEGKESSAKNESGYGYCSKTFLVHGRYVVQVSGEGTSDIGLLNKVIDSMNFGKLPK